MGKIIAIASPKGGTGKSTTAINLGAALSCLDHRVLLVDFDIQASLTVALGLEPNGSIGLLMQEAAERRDERSAPVQSGGMDVYTSGAGLIETENRLLRMSFGRELALAKALRPVASDYDYCLIDCPGAMNLMTICALAAADNVIIPIAAKYLDYATIPILLSCLDDVREGTSRPIPVDGILLTMHNPRLNLTKAIEAAVQEQIPLPLFQTRIPTSTQLAEASADGVSVFDYAPDSRAAVAYITLAGEVMGRG